MKGLTTVVLIFFLLGLAACATDPQRLNQAKHNQNCGTNEGVTLVSNNEVRLSLGQRPSAGYDMHYRRTENDGYVSVHYREITPSDDQFTAQMMTTPCVYLPLSDHWHTLQVINDDNGQMWEFHSQPVLPESHQSEQN